MPERKRLELWSQAAAHKPCISRYVVLVTGGISETERNIILYIIFFLIVYYFLGVLRKNKHAFKTAMGHSRSNEHKIWVTLSDFYKSW